ncbi:hypothetical protein ACIOHS_27380 [Streptomyces sp. NPDC088253]|uniref:hypothetical protein n=1 Tax=Streptomyces sp. NPDC088253 TaxID=3365846 RepID=UPI0038064C72
MADDVDFGRATITIDINDGNADGQARVAGSQIQRALLNATRRVGEQMRRQIQRGLNAAAVTVRVEPDLRRFDAQLLAGLQGIDALNIPVAPDVTGFVERLRALLADVEIPIRVVPDLDELDRRIRAHNTPDVRVNANVNVDANRLTRALSGVSGIAGKVGGALGGLLKLGAIGIAATGAAAGVAKFAAALAPAAGIIAAAPAAIIGFQAALGALKLALSGVSDAFQAALTGDSKAFEKSLENLSPKAQAAAREVRALKPAFDSLRNSVQDAFFAKVEGQITGTAKALQGPLKSGLTSISAAWGAAARGALGYLKGAQGVANVKSILGGTSQAVTGLSQTTNKLTAGLLQSAAVIAQKFGGQLGSLVSNLGQRFGTFLQNASQGGDVVRWVDNALTVFGQLGGVLQNIGSILKGVFSAASVSGGGVLANIQQITKSFAEFVNSASGQTAVSNIFGTVAQIAAQLGPILSALVGQLGQIAPALAPVFVALGPALVSLITSLGPALAAIAPSLQVVARALADGLGQIGPSLAPLGQAIATTVQALAPLLPLAGQLVSVLAQLLAPALQAVAVALAPVISALVGALLPILPPLAQAFGQVLQALVPLAAALGQALGQALAAAAPLLTSLAQVASQVVAAIVPLISALVGALLPVLPPLVAALSAVLQALIPILPPIAQLVAALTPLIILIVRLLAPLVQITAAFASWLTINAVVPIIQGVVTVLAGLVTAVAAVVGFIAQLPGLIVQGLSALGSLLATFFTNLFTTIGTFVTTGFQTVVGFFTQLPSLILAGLQALPGLLLNLFTSAVAGVAIAILTLIAGIVFTFTELPGRILAGLSSLGSFLLNAFVSGFNATTAAISSFLSTAASFFASLPGRIASALAALPGQIAGLFRSAGSSALGAARSAGSSVVSFFSGLPGRIGSALSSVGSKIAGAFHSAASSARSAVSSLISGVVSLFSGLGSKIVGAIGNVGSQIMSKIKSGIPSAVRKYLPFARGGIVYGPTHALIGEAGPEVVIPLSKPKRAAELAARSGLLDILGVTQARTLAAAGTAASNGTAANSALTTLGRALAGIADLLSNVGGQVVQGMVDGIRAGSGQIAAAAQDMAGAAITAAENTLQIASPSKVFTKIGRFTGLGFVVGITGTAAQIKAAAKKLVSDVAKIGQETGSSFVKSLATGTAAQIKSTVDKVTGDITKAFQGKKTRIDDVLVSKLQTGNTKLQNLAAQRDALVQKLADATKFAADTAKAAVDSFSLQNLAQGQDKLTVQGLQAGLQAGIDQVKRFTAEITNLAKRGLSKDLLDQVIGLGPVQGAQLADVLKASTSDQLKRLSSLQAQLTKASGALGTTSADLLFDAGKQAGAGFLAGLKAQRKNIEQLMLQIAKGMQASIRTALRIKSPSRVMMHLGDMTGAGLHIGFISRMAALYAAARQAAQNLVRGVSSQLSGMADAAPGLGGGNVVPLTRSQRLRQAGLDPKGLAGLGRGKSGGDVIHNHHWEIREVGSAHVTAQRVLNRFVLAAGVTG